MNMIKKLVQVFENRQEHLINLLTKCVVKHQN